jgi:hypothetical protein
MKESRGVFDLAPKPSSQIFRGPSPPAREVGEGFEGNLRARTHLLFRLEKTYNAAMDDMINIVLLVIGAALLFIVFWLHRRYTRNGPP